MKIVALILSCLPLFPTVSVAAQPAPWTIGERNGRSCFLTPEGKPFMMIGISHAVMALTEGGLRPVAASERARREKKIVSDLRAFGFNTVAVGLSNGGQPAWRGMETDFLDRMKGEFPFVAGMIRFVGVETLPAMESKDASSRYEDVFDPAFKARLREKARVLCDLCRDKPNCVGYWWSDIPPWSLEAAKKRFGVHWVDFIRALPETAPGRQRYEGFLKAEGPHDDAAFLRLIARELYTDSAAAFRKHDPRRLLFGDRYNGFDTPVEVLEEAAKVVDVISIQPSADKIFRAEKYDAIHRITKKPILISDWSLSYPTPEYPATMWQQLPTASETATAYEAYLRGIFSLPYCLGYFKCQYIDQPLPTGQLKQGLIKSDSTTYPEFPRLLEGIHQRLMEQWRLEGRLDRPTR
jgi:hypothetical protein